jgi:hypothetical protein
MGLKAANRPYLFHMNNSVGLGGVTLIIAAVVWLMIFVPGYTKRSQVKETSALVRAEHRQAVKNAPVSADDRLSRLINTQRGFSVLFALFLIGSIASLIAALANPGFWFVFAFSSVLAIVAVVTQAAAGKQASRLASDRHRSQLAARSRAQRVPPQVVNREWTPNTLPGPISPSQVGELAQPLADVIDIQKPKNTLSSAEIDAILARRRAI